MNNHEFKLGTHLNLSENERVKILNLGDGLEHNATVKGLAYNNIISAYILEPDNPIHDSQFGSCIIVPECCIIPIY